MINITYHNPLLGNSFATFPIVKQFAMQNNDVVNFVNNPFSVLLPSESWWVAEKDDYADITIKISDPSTGIIHNAMSQLNVKVFNPRNIIYPIRDRLIDSPYVIIAPRASGSIKELKHDVWQDIIDYVSELNYIPVVLGCKTYTRCINPNTEDMLTLQAWIPHASACISLSSGLFWMAHQYNVPTVKINGFCDERLEFIPTVQVAKNSGCRNCWNKGIVDNFNNCQIGTMECMDFKSTHLIKAISHVLNPR